MAFAPGLFDPATLAWLAGRFPAPTPVQARGWPLLAAGRHALLVAPTGSGKTLAAFLASIDRLGRLAEDAPKGVRVLYVSPLKALVADIERNLRAPISGIAERARRTVRPGASAGEPDPQRFRPPRVAIRTGDSSARERRMQTRDPAEILVTTPESLYLILGSQARETLATVETIIVDEIHALAGTKRGVHLALSLERVARRCAGGDPQRIGLSATARPTAAIARFLGGDRPVEIVDASASPSLELSVRVPVADMTRPEAAERSDAGAPADPTPAPVPSIWPAIHAELLAAIRAHRSSIVFTNSRALCECVAQAINELAGEPLVRAHHGSVAPDERREIEGDLAEGRLRGIVATSSLELGIDMAAVELVVLVESPGAVARGLQRIGRAGHAVGEISRGLLFPKHRSDLLESAVVARGMREGAVESISVPQGALDVLAQQIVALAAEGPTSESEIAALLARTATHAELDRKLLHAVLDMLAGRYPSTEFGALRPRIRWDRESGRIEAREGAGRIALLSGGTIPDRGQYAVVVSPDGPRIGELDEEMVHETKPGDVVVLGASSWRVVEIDRDRVRVVPAPGEPGRLPFWRGDGPGRPIELGRALGRFVREFGAQADPEAWLREAGDLDAWARRNLIEYLAAQRAATGAVPNDRLILIERFRDELGDHRVAIHSPFGARVHAPWALALSERFAALSIGEVHPLSTDDGIVLRLADMDRLPVREHFLFDPEEVLDLVIAGLERSALFAAQFRENAARSLLLPRRHARARTPLWSQRLRAQSLHAIARGHPDFPVMLETYRSCLRDVFDLPSLVDLMRGIEQGGIEVREVETAAPSPFARSLVFAYTAGFLYQLDMPAAERRSQALALDQGMLRELLGETDLRSLLDASAIDEVERRLQRLDPEARVASADGLHDRLRELGDLSHAELAQRFVGRGQGGDTPPTGDELERALDQLAGTREVLKIGIGGQTRWIAIEDAALYRDGLGSTLPSDLPRIWLGPVDMPLEQLVLRHARTHGPFPTGMLAARLGIAAGSLEPLLESLVRRGRLLAGEFDPRRQGSEWCDPEALRRIKKRTLARLREEIAPVSGGAFARFLLAWHGIASGRSATTLATDASDASHAVSGSHAALLGDRMLEVIDRLEGMALPLEELERRILPLRIPGAGPGLLDALASEGRIVWLGTDGGSPGELAITLHRRERVALVGVDRTVARVDDPLTELERTLLSVLERLGASFFMELERACGGRSREGLEEALWSLVARGLVTNDSLAPLRARRSLRRPAAGRPHRSARRPGRHAPPSSTSGRWSLVAPLFVDAPAETARLHARTLALLDRHGVVSRETLAREDEPGGFVAFYPVLRALEEQGRVRRGRFVEGRTSAEFALPGVVDRLRSARAKPASPRAVLLATLDPAQPWGAVLPWPPLRAGRARRAIGTSVVLVDGEAVLFVERGGHQLLCFDLEARERGDEPSEGGGRRADERLDSDERLLLALRCLAEHVRSLPLRRLAIHRIDGEPAPRSPHAPLLLAAGFRPSARGFELDRY